MKKTRLKHVTVKEISSVPKGANGKRRPLLLKHDDSDIDAKVWNNNFNTSGDTGMDASVYEKISKKLKEVDLSKEEAVLAVLKSEDLSDESKTVIETVAKSLKGFDLDKEKVTEVLKALGFVTEVKKEGDADSEPAAKAGDEGDEKVKKEDEGDEPVSKEFQEKLDAIQKRYEDENKELRETVEKMQSEKELEKFVGIAKEFEGINGQKADELGPVLMKLKKTDEASYDKFVESLKAVKAQTEKSEELLKEYGHGYSNQSEDDPYSKIEKLAKELQEKKTDITKEQAVAEVMKTKEGAKLYQEHLNR